MNHRERFIEVMTFGKPDRLLVWQLFGFMPGALERWMDEGMPAVKSPVEAFEFFGFDPQPVHAPADYGPIPKIENKIIEETEEYSIFTDDFGRTNKLIKSASTLPLPLDFPVKTMSDWEEWEQKFQFQPERVPDSWANSRKDLPVSLNFMGMYHFPRQLMGDLELSLAFYDQPELIRRILDTYTDLLIALGEAAMRQNEIDAVFLGEDYAYRGGPMISPSMFREFLKPYYEKIIGFFRQRGVKIFAVDSDGRVDELIPLLLEVGVNCFYPFEAQAGNDISAVRAQYGKDLAIIGGINKMAIAAGKEAIDRELDAKLPTMRATGGYAASLDHRVTVETSFENYVYYIEGVRRRLY
ncbi:MAG: uroporphyrinogen decarboxylase family protein [Armatimonadota bacterium]|nr:uroporphyrinogen decarboxylase family protein [Armatimonadota bacterium]